MLKKYGNLIGALCLFAALCAAVVTVQKSSRTLAQYAEDEPEKAWKVSGNTSGTVEAAELGSAASAEAGSLEIKAAAADDEKTETGETAGSTSQEETAMQEGRVTYQPDFYYEPLSEDIQKRIYGLSYKEDCTIPYEELRYVSVQYINFKGNPSTGEIICNQAIAQDLVEIFYELYLAGYQIEQIRLIDEYGADDILSMQDNNTSCFNYRMIDGSTKLSRHAQGLAIDINPFFNPYVAFKDGAQKVSPETAADYADRSKPFAYKIDENDLCYKLFIEHGFTWGGNWNSSKDYQHFEKAIQ